MAATLTRYTHMCVQTCSRIAHYLKKEDMMCGYEYEYIKWLLKIENVIRIWTAFYYYYTTCINEKTAIYF